MSRRRSLGSRLATLFGVCLALPAYAQEIEIQNWAAPPYWMAQSSAGSRRALAVPSSPMPFVAVAPCRVADTRDGAFPVGYGPPSLGAHVFRTFVIGGLCGIPTTAQAVSFLITAVNFSGNGSLRAFPTGTVEPLVGGAVVDWAATTAGAIVDAVVEPVGGVPGALNVDLNGPAGTTVDVVLDVNGYYSPAGIVNSLNALNGDITLSQGTDMILTPSGQTVTIGANSSSSNVGNTLVRRGPSGDFSAGSVTANLTGNVAGYATGNVLKTGDTMTGTLTISSGNIDMAPSSASSGNILKNGAPFIHNTGAGLYNTFVGLGAGNFTTTGTIGRNTAIGTGALNGITSGSYNTAAGVNALLSNAAGSNNTALGYVALVDNSGGSENTAIGVATLRFNATGNKNTATGVGALYQNASDDNTGSGHHALFYCSSGSSNTGAGVNAGGRIDRIAGYTGGTITFVPVQAGSSNTLIGAGTGATADVSNCTAVGADAYCDANNQVRLGNGAVLSIGGKVGWSALSDARAKKEIRDLALGLDFVLRLRPMEYKLKTGNERTDMGFLAQDVEALLGEEYNVLTVGGDSDRTLSLRYTDLIAPLVKAVQEQQGMLLKDREEIRALQAKLRQLESADSSRRPDTR